MNATTVVRIVGTKTSMARESWFSARGEADAIGVRVGDYAGVIVGSSGNQFYMSSREEDRANEEINVTKGSAALIWVLSNPIDGEPGKL